MPETIDSTTGEIVLTESATGLMQRNAELADAVRAYVLAHTTQIKGKGHLQIEAWACIAGAAGCSLASNHVERQEDGCMATGVVRTRAGVDIGQGFGFCGRDEARWAKADTHAVISMAQTRAMSKAASGVFRHIVPLIDASLSTTPAEEMPANTRTQPKPAFRDGPKPVPDAQVGGRDELGRGKTQAQLDAEAAFKARLEARKAKGDFVHPGAEAIVK